MGGGNLIIKITFIFLPKEHTAEKNPLFTL